MRCSECLDHVELFSLLQVVLKFVRQEQPLHECLPQLRTLSRLPDQISQEAPQSELRLLFLPNRETGFLLQVIQLTFNLFHLLHKRVQVHLAVVVWQAYLRLFFDLPADQLPLFDQLEVLRHIERLQLSKAQAITVVAGEFR